MSSIRTDTNNTKPPSQSTNDSFTFVDVEQLLESYTQDDQQPAGTKHSPALALTVTPRHDLVGIENTDTKAVQICATVSASDNLIKNEDERAPVDIAVALDVSGSMSGAKLDLCKATLELLIRELRPCDRFGLVSFADDARIEIPIRKLVPETKQGALDKVKRLRTRGCTNLSGGISLAIQDMRAVESPNEVRSIFVLTDGLANRGISDSAALVDLTRIITQNFWEKSHRARRVHITSWRLIRMWLLPSEIVLVAFSLLLHKMLCFRSMFLRKRLCSE